MKTLRERLKAFVIAVALVIAPAAALAADVTQQNFNTQIADQTQANVNTATGVGLSINEIKVLLDIVSKNLNLNLNKNENVAINEANQTASPVQQVTIKSAPSLIQLPGFFPVPSNFSQPYKPEAWANAPPPVVPTKMTRAQAEMWCRGVSLDEEAWEGGEAPRVDLIELLYTQLGHQPDGTWTADKYVGTSKASSLDDGSFIGTVACTAKNAMDHGINKATVWFTHRGKNRTSGFGIGPSGGVSAIPSAMSGSPYALAGVIGFGVGRTRAYVEAELILRLTGFRDEAAIPKPPAPRAEAPKAPPTLTAARQPTLSDLEKKHQQEKRDPWCAEIKWYAGSSPTLAEAQARTKRCP